MVKIFITLVSVILYKHTASCYPDLTPEAITVYRNPEFFRNLNFGAKINYNQHKSSKLPQGKTNSYKYPGETKKPNPLPSSGFEVNFDESPEFHHEPRDIYINPSYKPSRRRGPYDPKYNNLRHKYNYKSKKPASEEKSGEEESREDFKESFAESNESDEGSQEFISTLNTGPDKEFKAYHEPVLLARPGFDPDERSEFASSTYSHPYAFNRTNPVLYENWKHYTYPNLGKSKEFLKSDPSSLYNDDSYSFEADDSPALYKYDDDTEDISNFFDNDYKNLGSDTKHIYKKLINPKKAFSFKFHTKPKLKKLKFKLKKKHFYNSDWYNDHPFNF